MASLEASSGGSDHTSVFPSNQPELWLVEDESLSVTRTSFSTLLGLTSPLEFATFSQQSPYRSTHSVHWGSG